MPQILTALALALALLTSTSSDAISIFDRPCDCDCDLDGTVEVNELILLINVNLGNASIDRCPRYPGNRGFLISVSNLVGCINGLIQNHICSPPPPTNTPTITPIPPPTATPTEVFPPADTAASSAATELLETISVCSTAITPGGSLSVGSEPAGAHLICESFTGHNGSLTLLKYPSSEEAAIAFGQPREDETVDDLGGGTIRENKWNPFCDLPHSPPCTSRYDASATTWSWQRECWVARGDTFDDTGYVLTPRGPKVIMGFVDSGKLDDLIALCN